MAVSAGGIWTSSMPQKLAEYLPNLTDAERSKLFGDIVSVIDLPREHPTRLGVMRGAHVPFNLRRILISIVS